MMIRRIPLNRKEEIVDDNSTISQVDALLRNAIEQRASDIHLEPTRQELRTRFRIDGILIDQKPFSIDLSAAIIARLKILASLDSAERRIPQDGKFHVRHDNNEIDIRISTFP